MQRTNSAATSVNVSHNNLHLLNSSKSFFQTLPVMRCPVVRTIFFRTTELPVTMTPTNLPLRVLEKTLCWFSNRSGNVGWRRNGARYSLDSVIICSYLGIRIARAVVKWSSHPLTSSVYCYSSQMHKIALSLSLKPAFFAPDPLPTGQKIYVQQVTCYDNFKINRNPQRSMRTVYLWME